ncbi:hypothetical protein DFH09DRAFT_1148168 [Mycena vulgaris]|nr:hypothetical protein DFH09DRAFT_1148168 [Mycena vulgaris]
MPFTLNSTHIEGGTFNNVAGNMSQVFNSHAVHIRAPAASRHEDGPDSLPTLTLTDGSIGPIRPQRLLKHQSARPYAIADRSNGNPPVELPDGCISTSSRDTGNAILPTDYNSGGTSALGITFGDTFNSVGGDQTNLNVTSYGESGLDILYRSVMIEALHDSGERFPEPACHPGTRTAVLEALQSWAVATDPESTILWLHGSAGMGKSAIAQMFAGDCQAQGRLGASFFFRRGHPKRGTWHGLFPTIAYQLATSLSQLLLPVQQAVESDKLVVGRAMPVQFQKLILEPFRRTTDLEFKPVVVLDGLDECADHKVQQQILRLFIRVIQEHQLPLRLLIVSRPEPHIREVLGRHETSAICRHFVLSADQSAYTDIRTYLGDEFARIHSEYLERGIDLGDVWPSPDALEHLVAKSSGIFIYPTTVIRFIDDEYSHPADRLISVLRLDPRSTAPLDDLYTEILSALPRDSEPLRILHAIWQGTFNTTLPMDPEQLDMVLGLRPGTSRLVLRAVHSVFYVPPIRVRFGLPEGVYPLHATLSDYLGDHFRSGQWCISTPELHSDYLTCAIRFLSSPRIMPETIISHLDVVRGLSRHLRHCAPSETLIGLLGNQQFQDSLIRSLPSGYMFGWPQKDSGDPLDVIRLWEYRQFISPFTWHLKLSPNSLTSPTYKFDPLYTDILSRHSDLLFVLRSQIIKPHTVEDVLKILGPQHKYPVFQPFLEVRELINYIPEGDSPLDFLHDPRRAGCLYSDTQDIAEDLVLRWIQHTKELIIAGDLEGIDLTWLECLDECTSSPRILRELETLDVAQMCDWVTQERHEFHIRVFGGEDPVPDVLAWLRRFPDPPLQVIAFWEKQIADIRRSS